MLTNVGGAGVKPLLCSAIWIVQGVGHNDRKTESEVTLLLYGWWFLTTMGMHLNLAVTIFLVHTTLFSMAMGVLWNISASNYWIL